MKPYTLRIVTPTREVFNADVEHVRLPGLQGYFGVWASHAPFLAILDVGAAEFRAGTGTRYLSLSGGYAEVLGNRVTVIARSAEYVEEIDAKRAESARKRAADRLMAHDPGTDLARAQAALRRSILRLNLSKIGRASCRERV